MQNFVKVGHTVLRDIAIFRFSRWLPSAIFSSQIFKFLVADWVKMDNMHHHIKLHQNGSNDCGEITFNRFQNGGHPPSWIFKI